MRARALKSESGATMVEAALALPIFIFCILVVVDIARIGFHIMTVQLAVTDAARRNSIGMTADDVRNKVVENARKLGVTLNRANVHVCPIQDTDANGNCTVINSGTRNEYIYVTALLDEPTMVGGIIGRRRFQIRLRAVTKNEPMR